MVVQGGGGLKKYISIRVCRVQIEACPIKGIIEDRIPRMRN